MPALARASSGRRVDCAEQLADLRHGAGDLVDEALQVVDQGGLERLEVLAPEVVARQHLAQAGVEGPGAGDQPLELREHRRHLTGQQVGIGVGQGCVVVRLEDPQAGEDAAEHLGGDLAHLVGRGEQLLDLAMDQLAALGELVAGAGGEVLPDAARLGLARAAGEVAVADQVGQPGVDEVDVELQPVLRRSERRRPRGRTGPTAARRCRR